MNRFLNILDYALRSVFRRFSFHCPAVVAHSALIFLAASAMFTVSSLMKESRALLSASPEITVQFLSSGRQVPIQKDVADSISRIPGVTAARPRVWGYANDPYAGVNLTLWGVGENPSGQLAGDGLALAKGGLWKDGERKKILVGDRVGHALGLKGRKHVTLTDSAGKLKSYEIAGRFSVSSSLLTADLVLMPEADMREFFYLPVDQATDIAVSVANPAEVPMVAMKISGRCPSCRIVTKDEIILAYEAVLGFRNGMVMMLWGACLLSFLMVLWNRCGGHTPEERKTLAALKAVGWGTRDVMEMKMMEGAVLGGASYFLGVCAAYLHVYVFEGVLFRPALFGWTLLFPTFELIPAVTPGVLALLFMIAVLPYLAVTLMPAWKYASSDAAALREEAGG